MEAVGKGNVKMEKVAQREDNSDKLKKKKKKKKKVKICETLICKRSQGEDTAQGKDVGKADAKTAKTKEAKAVGTAAEKGPKVQHAVLGKSKERKCKEAKAKKAQLKRVKAKCDSPKGDWFKRELQPNTKQKTTGVGCTLKKVEEGSDPSSGEDPLGECPSVIPLVMRKGGKSQENVFKGKSGKDEKAKGDKRKRDIKTEAHKNEKHKETPRQSHNREREPPLWGLLDGLANASALCSTESSTLSLASGRSENSSLYLEEDSLIEICIGQAKLNSKETDCSNYVEAFCVSYFVYEDPLEIFSLFQGVSWLPELRNRCTSLNKIEFKPQKNIKEINSSAYVNINQCVHLRRRYNEVLNIVDDGIAYVFISIIGVNLKEYEKFYQREYGTMNGGINSTYTSYNRSDTVKPLNRFDHPSGICRNMDEEHQRGDENVALVNNLVEKYKNEMELELDFIGEKKIVTERNYKKFLHILGSSIIPIKVCNEGEAKSVENMRTRDSYNIYPHEVIRAVLYNYLDLFRKNKKANLFHLISKHGNELLPIGRLNIQSKEVKKDGLPPFDVLDEEDMLHNLSNGKSHAYNIAEKIFKYITMRRINKTQEKDNFIKEIKKLCSYLDERLNKKDPKYMNASFSYFEKCLQKMDDMKEQEKFSKKIRKKLFKMLELSKRKFPNAVCSRSCRILEVPCSHLIVFVHCVSNITLKLNSLRNFIDVSYFHGIILWEEEGNSVYNLQNVKDRKRRTIKLASRNGIQADYYFAKESGQRDRKMNEEKQDIVTLKLNFNTPVILPYNYNAPSCRLNFVLLHNDTPLLHLAGSGGREGSCGYHINDNVPFNEGDKVKKNLETHPHYLKMKGYVPFTENSRPFVELSFYTHPRNSTFFSAEKYKLLYKNKMKSNLGEDITLSSYSAPNFGRDKLVFHFFDDFSDDLRVGKTTQGSHFKSYFFVPIMGREMQYEFPEGKRDDPSSRDIQLFNASSRNIQSCDIAPRNALSSSVYMHGERGISPLDAPIQVIHFAVAEGRGLQGGEINKWHSFYVHTKNYRKRNIYGGKHVQIRIQIEPLGYFQLDYAANPCTKADVKENALSCYAPNKGLMGPDQFCFKSFSGIHELVDYKVEDLKNGTYEVTYQVHTVGRKLLYIFCDGIDVIGSPYEIKATPSGADPKSCRILGKGATQCLATPVLDLHNGPWVGGHMDKRQYEKMCAQRQVNMGSNVNFNVGVNLEGGPIHNQGVNDSAFLDVSVGAQLSSTDTKAGLAPSEGNLDGAVPEANAPKGVDAGASAVEDRPGETHPSSAVASNVTTPNDENDFHIISVKKRDANADLGGGKREEMSDLCGREEALASISSARRTPYCNNQANKLFCQPQYYDEIKGENITEMDKENKHRFSQLLQEAQILNTFTIILCDKNGVKVSIGNDNVKVVGKNGAEIKRVVDNNDGSYTVEYVTHFEREKMKKMFHEEDIEQVEMFYEEFLINCSRKENDNYIIEKFQRRFDKSIPICCQIHVYINEVEMFGSPLKPIIMNISQILHFFNLYFQFTYSGLLLKSFEFLLNCNDYEGCVSSLSSFYSSFFGMVDSEQEHTKLIVSKKLPRMNRFVSTNGTDKQVIGEKFFFQIPLNVFDLGKRVLTDSTLPGDQIPPHGHTQWGEEGKGVGEKYMKGSLLQGRVIPEMNESSFTNEWLHMHMQKTRLSEKEAKYDLGMNLAYSLSNIILQHLIYLKKYKFFINSKQYENGLLQNNILTQFRKLMEEEYNKMFAYQTNNIIKYCQKIGNVKFSGLEELIKVYKGIAFELRKLKKNDLADEFDKCCEHMCQELYLHNIESSLLRKEATLEKYEKVIDQKIDKVNEMKERLKKYQEKEVDIDRISKLCKVKRDKSIQTNDYLSMSHKKSFLSALIESRKDESSEKGETIKKNEQSHQSQVEEKQIRQMVRKYWRNASTYDIFVSIKKTMNNCPRLKISLDETFNYYSCSVKKDNKMKDFQIKKMQEIKMVENLDNLKKIDLNQENNNLLSHNDLTTFHLTYNVYIALLIDLRCNKFFIKDLDNVLWLFEKFSIQHHSFRNLYNPYGFLRVIPKYLFIAFLRELAYLNMLYVISECVVTNNEDEKILLNTNHPSRLSSFHHFVKYHFVPFYEELSLEPNFQNFKQNLIEHNVEEADPDSTKDTCSSKGGIITTPHVHINLLDLETYFNDELPVLVRHKNFEKTFPLLFDYYSDLSSPRGAPPKERSGPVTQGEVDQGKTASNSANSANSANSVNKDNMTNGANNANVANMDNQVGNGENAPCPEKHVSVAIFIRFLREFGIIPHFFSNHMALQTLQSFMQKRGKKKLNYDDFSHAILISICECVKKNILTQYNMLKVNNQLNSKIQTEKILNPSYIQYEAKELIYLFGFADMQLVRSKLAG
ncbi:conserved Plasmodium protein, unknown function [Plasmodium knowlesi strain H]|uniref:Uncharacterized protein n=3 Tax=Plasmodium knowlesi TaxID=5850 RepID=A0A5K1VBI3_PLAKH|nr:conserved protein, unknown function [Plasmodium knowlesi strain H]OTN64990.1 Uncharacterized protein PKNOH_S120130800 [Plasmodium knowlesi]CAA9988171.1 conserved protein, unknown function [Plasmodium knowlesi strain H]SBO20080.1 conserved Plasmodium protein, unknown function [Plasmodium knowlesi strain H]SBO20724.1 conserved Plasmodium protein, unknown function [Plasmodium knowlesi strain H]VVS77645.1 conserved protein, unknown function [Plasmodium knowlesi strain H]|eukprot:XP_002259147.1 hypothetical protein, conserved in Plasmodium species [Plasmodium knowlesi strain H]